VVAAAGAALAVGWTVGAHWTLYRDAALLVSGHLSRQEWLASKRFGLPGDGDFSAAASARAARYVRGSAGPEGRVLIWGFQPDVHLLSGRPAPGRFFFNVPVAVRFAPERWRREFLDDLRARPPELVLVLRNDAIPWANGRTDDSAAQLRQWPALREWLDRGYRFDTRIEDFSVYRRTAE
jgi:hypothetical protein